MIVIYHAHCITCGRYAKHLTAVKRYARGHEQLLELVDTRLAPAFKERHVYFVNKVNGALDTLPPVVVIEGEATLLTDWSLTDE